ncbi:hypothetical protein EV356DRAFT_535059 [Viridothelium virens]|uniref:Uncharacterized protein n=1 Tax=Viridothelium virens TaxID=1048519 RepID=A0A6A6H1Z6_VIRVR|nr:hypothetical protein EV356DRAFT_535059 [Viridothelium virens]
MFSSRSVLLSTLLVGIASASNVTFYSDTFCSDVITTAQVTDNLVCHQLPSPLPQSVSFHLSDFVSADLAGTAYTSSDCSSPCGGFEVTVENESPNAQYPIANGQCVSAQPNGATFGSYQFSAFR